MVNFLPSWFWRRLITIKAATSALLILGFLFALFWLFLFFLRPVAGGAYATTKFLVVKGDGLRAISEKLKEENLIRSNTAFDLYAVLSGKAGQLRTGLYYPRGDMSAPEILNLLLRGGDEEVEVVITEGTTVSEIERLLAEKGILKSGALAAYEKQAGKKLEGFLFPDTYRFFSNSEAAAVVGRFMDAFNAKALPLLSGKPNMYEILTVASILEKEIPHFDDRKVVAGILEKRLTAGWPLQVDAALCYEKPVKCYPLTSADLRRDSPYNTYLNKGLPPTPISNPGLDAISAALSPQKGPNWFYLSDPKTGNTIFAKTLAEHNKNRARYLK